MIFVTKSILGTKWKLTQNVKIKNTFPLNFKKIVIFSYFCRHSTLDSENPTIQNYEVNSDVMTPKEVKQSIYIYIYFGFYFVHVHNA